MAPPAPRRTPTSSRPSPVVRGTPANGAENLVDLQGCAVTHLHRQSIRPTLDRDEILFEVKLDSLLANLRRKRGAHVFVEAAQKETAAVDLHDPGAQSVEDAS